MIRSESEYNYNIKESSRAILRRRSYFILDDVGEFAEDICSRLDYTIKSVPEVEWDLIKYIKLLRK